MTFTETAASITNRVADLGVFQLILTASGTLDGFGPVTEVVGVTQDRAVQPCGAGSDSESDTRRIVAGDGTLALREAGIKCPVRARLHRQLRGRRPVEQRRLCRPSGEGSVTVDIATHTATLSGKLKLSGADG